ncbi:4-phosphopantetheinyl transferase [Flavobacterium akiainvivens]|uniref:4-phosphopantetheinyl transferase n=1 Tax=Flavobacterium akiainvivens TaxID=1202724 RepID=A0A0M8MBG9_9FLAO|nr:4'-phosphopantetheinyl transferase superfamily protein [Flavobacterium akiainvivens]KOS06625.1 4-phosphopantetheinyl transferase [Flavobacterium akiainvivens]SFQ08812.1 Phosphopantetheinyl transferase [Flavobacterium akiainvivens]
MPLYKSITIAPGTQLLIWQITESLEELSEGVALKDVCISRVKNMKSEQHRKGFMGVRKLLQTAGYSDFDLYYDVNGKPHLKDGKNISITHSFAFSAIIIGEAVTGIDMEIQREKVITIAEKFLEPEFAYLNPTHLEEYMRKLIIIWCVKEAVYKMISRNGLSFKQNITVHPFEIADGKGSASVKFEDINNIYPFVFEEMEGFTMAYSLEKHS